MIGKKSRQNMQEKYSSKDPNYPVIAEEDDKEFGSSLKKGERKGENRGGANNAGGE